MKERAALAPCASETANVEPAQRRGGNSLKREPVDSALETEIARAQRERKSRPRRIEQWVVGSNAERIVQANRGMLRGLACDSRRRKALILIVRAQDH
jgi:hypothetical protein